LAAQHVAWAAHDGFVTPMAAVAGSVAQELIGLLAQDGVHKAYVNNGGDIALHLQEGHNWRIGVVSDLHKALASDVASDLISDGQFVIDHSMPVRGVATSGWRGRSFSLGIADSVTVLAATAAQADVAATLIANAVNLDHPAIQRQPANSLRDDSDLGERLVTVDVPRLAPAQVARALQLGLDCAYAMQARAQVVAVFLCCQGRTAVTQTLECLV
ncbi:MAG: FAD:protein FMN transferase, partial [Burkholderiales bacterium]|nr:FAD:protein FMN transferase [Burkholderiales bacterium]